VHDKAISVRSGGSRWSAGDLVVRGEVLRHAIGSRVPSSATALHPADRGTDADVEQFGRFAAETSCFHRADNWPLAGGRACAYPLFKSKPGTILPCLWLRACLTLPRGKDLTGRVQHTVATEKRDLPRPLGRGDQSASAEGAFHTEGLKPVDATSIS
jgi:hypothetical protein